MRTFLLDLSGGSGSLIHDGASGRGHVLKPQIRHS